MDENEGRAAATSELSAGLGAGRHIALLQRHDRTQRRTVLVPLGQSLGFDEDGATRRWLWPYLGTEWHLDGFLPLEIEAPNVI